MPTGTPTSEPWSRWMRAWSGLSVPGACLAILLWGPGGVVGTAVMTALVAGLVVALVGHGQRQRQARPWTREDVAQTGRIVLCAVALAVSASALGAIAPGAGTLLLVLAGVTTPPVLARGRRVLRGPVGSVGARPEGVGPGRPRASDDSAAPSGAMSDEELCAAWRDSFWALRDARHPGAKLAVVRQREGLLDELETRHEVAVRAWLASGARASGSPVRFLPDAGDDRPSAA